MSVRTPTPDLIDAMRHDNERHEVTDRHVRPAMPGWERALLWGALIGTVVAIIWRFSQ
jgi:hypothetical protein